jgi:hypothetical protein
MDDTRYALLMRDDAARLTTEEQRDGWHFCPEWDGLLVGPGMTTELESCSCFSGSGASPMVRSSGRK